MIRATGTFDVKMTPQPAGESPAGRMLISKQYHGDLEGSATGEMLATMDQAKGSGVYVAIEKVTGVLKGKRGSFLLHHRGVMDRGKADLAVFVVPDSGTDELAGLTGSMKIIIEGSKHSYEFEYALP